MEVDGELATEVGYDFRSDYWNQGSATEAATAVRDYALDVLQLPCSISLIWVGNIASMRVAEKIGMTQCEILRGVDLSRKKLKYSIDQNQFKTNREK